MSSQSERSKRPPSSRIVVRGRPDGGAVEDRGLRSRGAGPRAACGRLDFPAYGGGGLTTEFRGASWSQIRDEVYRGRGA